MDKGRGNLPTVGILILGQLYSEVYRFGLGNRSETVLSIEDALDIRSDVHQ